MRNIYILTALVVGSIFQTKAQTIVFNTSIESWSSGLPTDMFGPKSNIAADSVVQVTGSSDFGNNAARLKNPSTTHKRFTNLPMTVTNTKTYEIKFWVKGEGEIRTSMFDGRSTGFGYATYNPYIMVNTSTWTEYAQNITCENDTTAGEFILSVRNTVAPNHIMIDSVIITELSSTPTNVSIYQIQYTTTPPYNSPYNGQNVTTGGIVTAFYFNGYFVQSGYGAWHGIEVYDTTNNPVAGDSITFTALVDEYFNNTRLKNVTGFTTVGSGFTVPAPAPITTTTGNTEDYEGVLVNTQAECTDDDAGFGMWTVYTSPDSLKVDDLMYSFTPTIGFDYDITGIITYSFGEFKLNPRKPSDVTVISSVNENNVFEGLNIYPNPSNEAFVISNLPMNSVISVLDLTGKIVLTTKNNLIATSSFSNGTYMVKIMSNDAVKTVKLVVKH